MDNAYDDEARELRVDLARVLGERTAALLIKRVMAIEGRDGVTSRELSELGAAIMARFEQVDARFEQVDARVDARREADDGRFEMLAGRVDNGFDRIQSDLRGQLLAAVTTQTRTLLFALLERSPRTAV